MSRAAEFVGAFATAEKALTAISLLFAIGTAIGSLELFVNRRRLWHHHGLLDWTTTHQRSTQLLATWLQQLVGYLGRPLFLDSLMAARFVAAVALTAAALGKFNTAVPLAVIATVQLVINWRLNYLLDGSDKVMGLLAITLLLAAVRPQDPVVQSAALHFLTAQVTFGYAYAGLVKAVQRAWWNGSILSAVLGTVFFGDPLIHRWNARWPFLAGLASTLTILVESTFPLALVGPPSVTLTYLVVMGLFHASVAAVMGLNSFVYAFVATYPAVCFTSAAIRAWMSP